MNKRHLLGFLRRFVSQRLNPVPSFFAEKFTNLVGNLIYNIGIRIPIYPNVLQNTRNWDCINQSEEL